MLQVFHNASQLFYVSSTVQWKLCGLILASSFWILVFCTVDLDI